ISRVHEIRGVKVVLVEVLVEVATAETVHHHLLSASPRRPPLPPVVLLSTSPGRVDFATSTRSTHDPSGALALHTPRTAARCVPRSGMAWRFRSSSRRMPWSKSDRGCYDQVSGGSRQANPDVAALVEMESPSDQGPPEFGGLSICISLVR